MFNRVILDLEANNLMNPMLDFTKKPLRFLPEYTVWCISLRCIDTNKTKMLVRPDLLEDLDSYIVTEEDKIAVSKLDLYPLTKDILNHELKDCRELSAHNGIKFDFPVLKLMGYLDYNIGYPYLESIGNTYNTESTLFGRPVTFTDTLVLSKLLNADRYGGHSLKNFGDEENQKLDFHEFDKFSINMLVYCEQDTSVNRDAYFLLNKERNGLKAWDLPFEAETKLADISLNQELFGFDYDLELSEKCKIELDALLKERYEEVTPLLPPRPLNKGEQKYYTPPKTKWSKSSNRISAAMTKFFEKMNADYDPIENTYEINGKVFDLYNEECVLDTLEADIKDLDHLKSYLISLGWVPSQWNVRDLTKDSKKKQLSFEKFEATLDRYVDDTFNGFFKDARLEELGLPLDIDEETFRNIFYTKYMSDKNKSKKPIRVPTSPPLKVGASKELCPNLEAMRDEIPFIKSVIEFFTYQHRRNSIAGNVDEETGEANSGFESYVRSDGRVSTPVDTNGASTSRMIHREIKL